MSRHQAQTWTRYAISGVEQHLGQPPVAPDERAKNVESSLPSTRALQSADTLKSLQATDGEGLRRKGKHRANTEA